MSEGRPALSCNTYSTASFRCASPPSPSPTHPVPRSPSRRSAVVTTSHAMASNSNGSGLHGDTEHGYHMSEVTLKAEVASSSKSSAPRTMDTAPYSNAPEQGLGKGDTPGQSAQNKYQTRVEFVEYMIETTVFQGPGKMWAAPVTCLKVMWLLFFVMATGALCYLLMLLCQEYFSWHVKIEMSVEFSPLALPAVTVCNANPVRMSHARTLSCMTQSILGLLPLGRGDECQAVNTTVNGSYDFSFLDCYGNGCRETQSLDSYSQRLYLLKLAIANESREARMRAGHQGRDLILRCAIHGRICSFESFTQSLSLDYGNCYTLSVPDLKAATTGPLSGLEVTVDLETEEFVTTSQSSPGLRVVLHENGTRPNPTSEGFTVSAGSEVDVGLSVVTITNIGKPHGACDTGENFFQRIGYKYTMQSCREFCLRTAVLQTCKCAPPEDDFGAVSTDKSCSTETEWGCLKKVYSKYHSGMDSGTDMCSCQKPCTQTIYRTTITSQIWPTLAHVSSLEAEACARSNASYKCNYTDDPTTTTISEFRRSSFLKLRVYYDSLNFETITEKPLYPIERFLSDIGGTLGFWIGASVMGLCEFVELVILLCMRYCKTKNSTRDHDHQRTREMNGPPV